jgi:hypothetical protein
MRTTIFSTEQQRRAMDAVHAARRLFPPTVARVVEEEIMATYEFLSWMGAKSRTRALIEQILDLEEEREHAGHTG